MQISQNKKNDKKYLLIALSLVCVGLLAVILVVVFSLTKPAPCAHVDEDQNATCDLCGEYIGIDKNTEQPSDKPDDGDNPVDEPSVDYTVDVDNAASKLLEFLNGENETLLDNVELTDILFSGSLLEQAGSSSMPEMVEIDGDKMYYEYYSEDDILIQTYIMNAEEGIYTVVYDGYHYNGTFEKVDAQEPIQLTAEDIVYNEQGQYFAVTANKIASVKDVLLSNVNLDLDMIDLGEILNELTYTLRFKIDENNNIVELQFKGVSEIDDVTTDVLSMTYTFSDVKTTSSLVVNYYVLVKMDVVASIGADNKGQVTLNGYIKPPMGVEMETMDISMTANAVYKNTTITFSEDVKAAMDAARDNAVEQPDVDLTEVLSKRYSDRFACDTPCELIYVYDVEYGVYVYLNFWRKSDTTDIYGFAGYSKELDRVACSGTIGSNNVLYVAEHHVSENIEEKLRTKYEGQYSGTSCDSIIVYDNQYSVYIYFARHETEESVYYTFNSFASEKADLTVWGIPCEGRIENGRIITEEHAPYHALVIKYKTVVQENIECQAFYIYDKEYNMYISFEKDLNQEHTYVVANIDVEAPIAYCEYRTPDTNDIEQGVVGLVCVEHSGLCGIITALTDKTLTVNGNANGMPIYVVEAESEYLLVFYPASDNTQYKLVGYTSFGTANATLDLENLVLNLQ